MEESNKLLLCYWQVRGRVQPVRYLLEYLQLPYEEKRYDLASYEDWFVKDKPNYPGDFPNLPYMKDGERFVSETEAIYRYICYKSGRKDLLGKTEDDEITVSSTRWVIYDAVQSVGELAYNPVYESIKESTLEEKVLPKLSNISKFLGDKEFLQGYLTYNDFILFELLEILLAMKSDVIDQLQNIKEFHAKFKEQKFMKEYFASSRFIFRPFYGMATWNPME